MPKVVRARETSAPTQLSNFRPYCRYVHSLTNGKFDWSNHCVWGRSDRKCLGVNLNASNGRLSEHGNLKYICQFPNCGDKMFPWLFPGHLTQRHEGQTLPVELQFKPEKHPLKTGLGLCDLGEPVDYRVLLTEYREACRQLSKPVLEHMIKICSRTSSRPSAQSHCSPTPSSPGMFSPASAPGRIRPATPLDDGRAGSGSSSSSLSAPHDSRTMSLFEHRDQRARNDRGFQNDLHERGRWDVQGPQDDRGHRDNSEHLERRDVRPPGPYLPRRSSCGPAECAAPPGAAPPSRAAVDRQPHAGAARPDALYSLVTPPPSTTSSANTSPNAASALPFPAQHSSPMRPRSLPRAFAPLDHKPTTLDAYSLSCMTRSIPRPGLDSVQRMSASPQGPASAPPPSPYSGARPSSLQPKQFSLQFLLND